MSPPTSPPAANIDLYVHPEVCYRASDRTRPRWRFLLVAVNKSRRRLVLRKLVAVQHSGSTRRQRTLTGDALDAILIQGAGELGSGKVLVCDVQEPPDTGIAASSVGIRLEFSTRSGRRVSCSRLVGLTPCRTRFVQFPLDGAWLTVSGRGDRHCVGTQFGFDFIHREDVRLNENPPKHRVPLREFASFGQPLYAPASGEVVACEGGQRDLRATLTKSTFTAGPPRGKPMTVLLGNYVLLKLDPHAFVFLAHVRQGSLQVAPGHRVEEGTLLGNVGNSGNTTQPHLHMEMLDREPDFSKLGTLGFAASGLPFGFRNVIAHQDQGKDRPLARLAPEQGDYVWRTNARVHPMLKSPDKAPVGGDIVGLGFDIVSGMG